MNSGEFNSLRHMTLALLASLGAGATAPATSFGKSAKCDVPAAVKQIKQHTREGDTFNWPVVRSSNHEDGFVLMTDKRDDPTQPTYNPLAIRCGGRTMCYVGITTEPNNLIGRRHKVGGGTGLYLDVYRPGKAKIVRRYLKGHVVLAQPQLKLDTIHPISQTNLPAFVQQPGPSTLENSYGVMSNGLVLL